MKKRVRVASWCASRPRGAELRIERPEFKDPQKWLVVVSIAGADGAIDTHTIKAAGPCALMDMVGLADASIKELCADGVTAKAARMEFFANV